MQTVGDRIDLICKSLDVSRRKFAERIQEKPSTIASIVRGASPSANIICSILSTFSELNERWLLMGEGNMWKLNLSDNEQANIENLSKQLEHRNETIQALKGQVSALERMVELLEKQLNLIEKQFELAKKAS